VKKNILAIGILRGPTRRRWPWRLPVSSHCGRPDPTSAEHGHGDSGGHGLFARFRAHRHEVRTSCS
jgi:hypothetical protein